MTDLPFVDTEELVDDDGEIDDVIVGDIDLSYVAGKALEATEQEKLWDVQKRRWNGMLAHRQIDGRAVYGDASVRCWFQSVLSRQRLRALIEEAQLSEDDIYEFVFAASRFSSDLPPKLRALVDRAMVPSTNRSAQTTRARKLAPEAE